MNKKWIAAITAVILTATAFAAKPKIPSYLTVQNGYWGGEKATIVSAKDLAAIPADLVIPDGVTQIDSFANCTSIRSITIPKSVKVINVGAFGGCTSLERITIPDSVTKIGERVFINCTSLKNVVLPDSVTEIGEMAFKDCASLASIVIPNSVRKIGKHAFGGCTSLKANYGGTKAQWYAIQDGWEKFPSLIHCTDGTLVMEEIPAYLKMEGWKIIGCDKDKLPANLVIPDGVMEIGNQTFADCTSLKSVTIPSSVKKIGENAFPIKEVQFSGTKAQWNALIGENSKYFSTVHCTDGIVGVTELPAYLKIDGTKITGCDKNKLPDNLVIPEGVTEIGHDAFEDCTYLESVVIPGSVKEIGGSAFSGCTSLKTIAIPDSVKEISSSMFYNCASLNNVKIPDSVESIGESAFAACASLTSIKIPNSVTEIGSRAFYRCTSLKSIVIPDSVTEIGGGAFSGCTSLVSIAIPSSVTKIGNSLFSGCTSLKSIVIPDSVTEIDSFMFEGCTSLASVTIGSGVTRIGDSAFEKCTSLTSIVIPRGVTGITMYAFRGCKSLKSVSIPRSVTWIHASFMQCPNLSVQYDGTKAQWEAISNTGIEFDKGIIIHCTDGNIVVN